MTVSTVTSASAGTKLATTTDTHIVGMTMVALPTSMADTTPLVLLDAAVAPTGAVPVAPILYAADLNNMVGQVTTVKPNVPLTPGMTTPVAPFALGKFGNAFAKGVWVQSCPANVSFSLTTG
jgi:hypothetical protein